MNRPSNRSSELLSRIAALERQVELINRFPDQNPNPVMRASDEGFLLYGNAASVGVARALGCTVGERLPADVQARVRAALDGTGAPSFEVETDGHTYLVLPVQIEEFGFVNLYGTDVTARKAMNKFPDQNPNPVLRASQDGRLVYANAASELIRRAFGVAVGEMLPAEWFGRIRDLAERDTNEVMVVEIEDRVFSVLVKNVFEFSFINLYGTDITADRDNERLLLNILPAPIAVRLRAGEKVIADRFEDLTLMFADIVDFTAMSSRMSAADLVDVLNEVFSLFDDLVDQYRLEKIKTIGDSYMVVGGIEAGDHGHARRVAEMALALASAVTTMHGGRHANIRFRIGVHCGPAVAGVIGTKRFIYDVWGDTVNTASRMESHGIAGAIQVTQAVMERLRDEFVFEPRGMVEVKGKGSMPTWFLTGRVLDAERRPGSPFAADTTPAP